MEKKKAWYHEQLVRERELTHQVEVCLCNETGRLEERHLKDSQIWAKMKSHYEEAVMANKRQIENLKKALDKVQTRSQTITDTVHVLLQTNRVRFTTQLKAVLDKDWTVWATQAAEL